MNLVRASLCGFSFVAALVALANHLGYDLWNCASCSFVDDMPIGAALAWGGPVVLGLLAYGSYRDLTLARALLPVAALASVGLVAWMIQNHAFCMACVLVHIGVISAAIAVIPKPRFLSLLVFSVAIVFTATGGWDRYLTAQTTGIFRPRDGEVVPSGVVYVLFTDPECSSCKMFESGLAQRKTHPQVLYRWSLLPHSMYRSIRAAAVLEMARERGPREFEALRLRLAHVDSPLTDEVLIREAVASGLSGDAKTWLQAPPERALIAIDDDQTSSQELKITSLPALAELSPPGVGGLRTMRLVPIGTLDAVR